MCASCCLFFFFSSRRRHTRCSRDWSSDVCSSDIDVAGLGEVDDELLATGFEGVEHLLLQLLTVADDQDRKSTRLNSSHGYISYAVFCLKKKKTHRQLTQILDETRRSQCA